MPEDASSVQVEPPPPPATQPLVAWPPPGLERLQGDLWSVAVRMLVGGAVFTLPLLAALSLPQQPWGLGVYGDAWWVLLISAGAGLWVLATAFVMLLRVLRRWSEAVRRGYAARTVALVLTDGRKDSGFLVQGGRAFSQLTPGVRRALLAGRLLRVGLLLGAGLWLSVGFAAGVLVSARGFLDEGGLAVWTLGPIALAFLLALASHVLEDSVVSRARKAWHKQPWSEDLAREEIRGWHDAALARQGVVAVSTGQEGKGVGALRATAVLAAVAGVFMVFLSAPLVLGAGIGPVLATVATPKFSETTRKASRTEALLPLRLPVDPTVTPALAGEAMASLLGGDRRRSPVLRDPPRTYEPAFDRDESADNPTGLAPHFWARDLVPRLAEGLDAEVVAYLRDKGRHPAFQELSTLARAGGLDDLAALYVTPLPDDLGVWELPIPRYSGLRELSYAQVGAAVGDAASGDLAGAETRLRELVSVGLLIGREGETLLSNLIGFVIAGVGAEALGNLYEATGQEERARALRSSLEASDRAAERALVGAAGITLSRMPDVVTDTMAIRGMRWEYYIVLSSLGPCLNLKRAVFGPPPGHEAWLEEARASLVRVPSEAEFFRLASRGWWGGGDAVGGAEPVVRWGSRLYAWLMGTEESEACAALAAELSR